MSTQSESIISPKIQEDLLKIFPGGVVFFDLETTGLSPLFDRVIEFAGIKILRGSKNQKRLQHAHKARYFDL